MVVAGRPARIVLFSRPGCHLCDDMRTLVLDVLEGAGSEAAVRDIDIASDPALTQQYRHDIPVLCVDGQEIARHRIGEPELAAALRRHGVIG